MSQKNRSTASMWAARIARRRREMALANPASWRVMGPWHWGRSIIKQNTALIDSRATPSTGPFADVQFFLFGTQGKLSCSL